MLRRLPVWSIRSKSNSPASSRRHIIITAIIAALLAAIIAVPIIMALLIIALPIIMAVIAIIAVLLAAIIAGLIIIRMVIIIAVASGITFIATAAGGIDKEAPVLQAWRFFLTMPIPTRFRSNRLGPWLTYSILRGGNQSIDWGSPAQFSNHVG